ncbi:uncharacterized protein AB675_1017 [Cyphellophora attinorum]|uniref:Queuosine 5'-phosphate N-glycosylase/hydrolase n=1 Tax=Cyphellophora attinorum TaxID=1664694 RepID=A0A0N1NXT6_9EURO|nr:uncharacterized protein AB675_1017 [Phialophora attinorum]KPI38196.1 hypothetical protein AB675_1017 [Phialophora attinorum]
MAHIFRSATNEPMPLYAERVHLLRTAFDLDPLALINEANHSAARLVNLLTSDFPNHFSDTDTFANRTVSLHKRAQILVADLWACFRGQCFGNFDDIGTALTMFADYRVPQMLQRLGVLRYSPRLETKIRRKEIFESGEDLEVEIRGCSVWAVELLRREIVRLGGETWEVEVEHEVDECEAKPPSSVAASSALRHGAVSGGIIVSRPRKSIDATAPDAKVDIESSGTKPLDANAEVTDPISRTGTESIKALEAVSLRDSNAETDTADVSAPTMTTGLPTTPSAVPSSDTSADPHSIAAGNAIDTADISSPAEPSMEATEPHLPARSPSQATELPATASESPTMPPLSSSASSVPKKERRKVQVHLNAVLLDYLLYDTAKELEAQDLAETAAGNTQALQEEQQQLSRTQRRQVQSVEEAVTLIRMGRGPYRTIDVGVFGTELLRRRA